MVAEIRTAGPGDAEELHQALAALSHFLGDTHLASAADLRRAGWGAAPVFRAQLAEASGCVCGVAMYSPLFSKRYGAPGIYVTDLWVADGMRQRGLARRLLIAAMQDGKANWGADYLKLTVDDTNTSGRAFYENLQFRPGETDTNMFINANVLIGAKGEK